MYRGHQQFQGACPIHLLPNDSFDLETKEHIVELLWQVAYADGAVDKYEAHLVRRIADLIHVSHRSFIAAKLRSAPQ